MRPAAWVVTAGDLVVEGGAQRDARRAGAEGLEPRLVVADAFGEQRDEPAGGEELAGGAEGGVVAGHGSTRRPLGVLGPVDRHHAGQVQERGEGRMR
jgi:hypothetical protein